MTDGLTRRRLLALAATGVGCLAGCGYRPGGGDVRWTASTGTGMYGPDDLFATAERFVAVNRSEQSYDFETDEWGRNGHVAAYDPADGAERWTRKLPQIAAATTTADSLFVALDGDELAALDPDGAERWRVPLDGTPRTVAASDGRVYVRSAENVLSTLDARDGTRRWRFEPDVGGERFAVGATADGAFLATTSALSAVSPGGERRWRVNVPASPRSAVQPSVAADGTLYCATGERLRALAVEDGTERWSVDAGRPSGRPAVRDGTVYHVGDGALSARSAADGTERWRYEPTGRNRVTARPLVAGDAVYVNERDGLTALAADDGTVRWTVDGDEVAGRPVVVGRTVAVRAGGEIRGHHRS